MRSAPYSYLALLSILALMPMQLQAAPLPRSAYLDIPFTSQAPHGNWGLPYQEACEEASALMVHMQLTGTELNPEQVANELDKIVAWETKKFGDYKHATAEQTAQLLREYFDHQDVRVVYDIVADDIKHEIVNRHAVILPAAGRMLGNKYFHRPGPVYHMLVVRGYDWRGFVTNDPGTRHGKNFRYSTATLMRAVHDWDETNITNGRTAMIVVDK
jgi:hypothetical protein